MEGGALSGDGDVGDGDDDGSLSGEGVPLGVVDAEEADAGDDDDRDGDGVVLVEILVLTTSTAELSTRLSATCARVDHTRNSMGVVPSIAPQPISSAPMNEPSFGLTRVSPAICSSGFTAQARSEISTFNEANAAASVLFRPPNEIRAVSMPDTLVGSVENGRPFSGRV